MCELRGAGPEMNPESYLPAVYRMRALVPIALQSGSLAVGADFDADCAIAVQLFMRRDADPVRDADLLRLWDTVWSRAGRVARSEVVGLFRLPPAAGTVKPVVRATLRGQLA